MGRRLLQQHMYLQSLSSNVRPPALILAHTPVPYHTHREAVASNVNLWKDAKVGLPSSRFLEVLELSHVGVLGGGCPIGLGGLDATGRSLSRLSSSNCCRCIANASALRLFRRSKIIDAVSRFQNV